MSMLTANPLEAFHWEPQPATEKLVRELIAEFLSRNSFARQLAERMQKETGTRFYDWVETISVPDSPAIRQKITAVGYEKYRDRDGEYGSVFSNPLGMFARIGVLKENQMQVHLKVGNVADFAAAFQIQEKIEGEEFVYRRLSASKENGSELLVSERWGWAGYDLPPIDPKRSIEASRLLDLFCARRRDLEDDADGYEEASRLIDSSRLSVDLKCALFFEAERRYWQRRNRAAQVQRARQDRLGLGWGNHDHHTYRCSRENFKHLVTFFEKLGFHCRERFYAGREAGWGAQVMEQPVTGVITFNDVDLTPDELMGDFSHDGLARARKARHGWPVVRAPRRFV